MRPSLALAQHREAVCQMAARYRVANPRVFGSALHGHDVEGSDLDLLVDVLTPKDLPAKFRDVVVQEARPL